MDDSSLPDSQVQTPDLDDTETFESAFQGMEAQFSELIDNSGALFLDSDLPLSVETEPTGSLLVDNLAPGSSVTAGNEDPFLASDFPEYLNPSDSLFNFDARATVVAEGSQDLLFNADAPVDWGSATEFGGLDLGIFGQGISDPLEPVPSNNAPPASTTSQAAPAPGPVSRLNPETWLNGLTVPSNADPHTRAQMIEIIRASAVLLDPVSSLQRRNSQNSKPKANPQKKAKKVDKKSPPAEISMAVNGNSTPRQSSQENPYTTTISIAPRQSSQENPYTTAFPTAAAIPAPETIFRRFPPRLETGITSSSILGTSPENLGTSGQVPDQNPVITPVAVPSAQTPNTASFENPQEPSAQEIVDAMQSVHRLYVTKPKLVDEGREYIIKGGEAALVEYTGFSKMNLVAIHDNNRAKKTICVDDVVIVISESKVAYARIHCTLNADDAVEAAKLLTGVLRVWLEGHLHSANFYLLSPRLNNVKPFYAFHKDEWNRRSEAVAECIRGFAREFNAPFFFQPFSNTYDADALKLCYIQVGPFGEEGDENRPHVMIDDRYGKRIVRDSL
ncbi:hypothetical protein UA08_08094 [Talaromyces atroroseus]|uniref:Uncharacterized protein n=1 Tax=Talaromyces atroroseus TaxID=1441469 RepID=A0A225AET0_TALAT|nr:hypothetical protein UA08_08094 [Talaromyces atroroseus]OKL56534.1 hypothetical protein UA08_08094 [Talaromyces atroroseus]